jgi:signal transduction histidine kinase
MPFLKFSVDSALLQELGERLVGKPYIALAELVKNSYDADSTYVKIELNPELHRIVVSDNGHGMNLEEFDNFWMRIGSVHKTKQRISRNFNRVMTGSKGVGRLAVQYLANKLSLITVSEKDISSKLEAFVDWSEAIQAGDLTEATVEYNIVNSNNHYESGTQIILENLEHKWDTKLTQGLAKEIWWLQSPFRSQLNTIDKLKAFEIEFVSSEKEFEDVFNRQIKAILDIWNARLIGKNENGKVSLSLEFAGENPVPLYYNIQNCNLKNGDFEIRIYHLVKRQPRGIRVGEARQYLNEFGGVYVYDGGFQLPFYGDPKNDWLKIEFDHSHRLSKSQLLPKEIEIDEGYMEFLPTLSRIFGVVNVNTREEPKLDILITRDRFQESISLENLIYMVRYAIDFYALEEKKRSLKLSELETKIEKPKVQRIEEALEPYKDNIPEDTYNNLKIDIRKVANEIETEAEETAKRVSLMGALATAGITSLAYQHETKRQFRSIKDIISQIGDIEIQIENENLRNNLRELKRDLEEWVERARLTNSLFAYISDEENIKTKRRFSSKEVIEDVKRQVSILSRGVKIDTSKVEYLLLPEASLAEWSSIFQNVLLNAFNALLDSKKKLIQVSTKIDGREKEILIQDTGCGVDLQDAETLFEPFVRKVKISPERRALGYGGTGLGLTIVRMIANNIGCKVSFIKPEKGFSTAFSIKWSETK